MVTEKTLMEFGFANDENCLQLKDFFKNNIKLKEIHMDIYPENPLITSSTPFMLLLRTIERKVTVTNDEDRLILKRNVGGFEACLINVLFSKITECYYKSYDGFFEFILNIQNIYYRITIFN